MKDNPKFKLLFESRVHQHNGEPLRFYTLADMSEFHMSRYVAANAQNIYSASGITPDLMNAICDNMIAAVNEKKIADVAVWANNLKYRTKYPVDENAVIRMAMIYSFVEGEDPDKCENHWTEWKTQKVLDDPEAYSFFLPIGLQRTPAYSGYLEEISESSLLQRREALKALTPAT